MKCNLLIVKIIAAVVIQFSSVALFSQNLYSVYVTQPDPISTPSICVVSVGDYRNVVVWDNPSNDFVDYFRIYRESTQQTGEWDSIGFVSSVSTSVFIDSTSEPSKQSYRYKISSVDKCGNETALSSSHKTINLSVFKSIDNTFFLIWNEYEGFSVSSYRIYRGTSIDDLTLIGSTTAGNLKYNDSYLPVGPIYYQVEVLGDPVCNTDNLKSTIVYNSSRSNIVSNITAGLNALEINPKIKVIPNPFSFETQISFLNDNNENYTLSVYDLSGKKVKTENVNRNPFTFYSGNLSEGLYYIELNGTSQTFRKKIMIVK